MINNILENDSYDVAIIGGGPAGLAAATELKRNGIEKVVVLDRETEAGGIPRHCGHPPFGLFEYKRILTGPAYAKKIVETAENAGVEIVLRATVTSLGQGGALTIVSPGGSSVLNAKRVLLATGTRETPRSARLVSGIRALGICNTGALQSMVYLKKQIPFKRPVVVGTEIVSFSALYTCKKAGVKPVAMLEENLSTTVSWPVNYGAKLLGVPLFLGTKLVSIRGHERVESVLISDSSENIKEIVCDGVLFTGLFTPESSLVRMSHLEMDTNSGMPTVDLRGRCSDPSYYAAGNVLQKPVKVAGTCWKGGRDVARWIAKDL